MFLEYSGNNHKDIMPEDKLGTTKNYALLYPIIRDCNNQTENRWLVIVYDTPEKIGSDIMDTVKNVVNKILELPFKYVIPIDYSNGDTYPKVEITYTCLENNEDQNVHLQNYMVSSLTKRIKTDIYQELPKEELPELLNSDFDNGGVKKIIKVYTDSANRKSYKKYEVERNVDGTVSQSVASKYSYEYEIAAADDYYTDDYMLSRFIEVVGNYLSNGQHV